jgi:hypothetical protein
MVDPAIRTEWRERHSLAAVSLRWLAGHAEPGDEHPVLSAIAWLRAHADDPGGDEMVR